MRITIGGAGRGGNERGVEWCRMRKRSLAFN